MLDYMALTGEVLLCWLPTPRKRGFFGGRRCGFSRTGTPHLP